MTTPARETPPTESLTSRSYALRQRQTREGFQRFEPSQIRSQPSVADRSDEDFGVYSNDGASSVRRTQSWRQQFKGFWRTNITPEVQPAFVRDHLALERTFLAWIRTSIAVAMMGIIIAQLFVLNRTTGSNASTSASSLHTYTFDSIGMPLAASIICLALVMSFVSMYRFVSWQTAMMSGKAISGGWEIWGLGAISFAALLVLIVLLICARSV